MRSSKIQALLLVAAAVLCLDCAGTGAAAPTDLEVVTTMGQSPWAPQSMTGTFRVGLDERGARVDVGVEDCSDFALWGQVPAQGTLVAPTP